ncbi:MAG: hypothetical protein WD989_01770 [Candidatus Paceibacterota bacterium]
MIKKLFAKLIGWREKESNFAARTFQEESAQESREAAERHKDIMDRREKKYVSEVTTENVLGPSDSALKEEKQETSE